jgi:hypothetical protein
MGRVCLLVIHRLQNFLKKIEISENLKRFYGEEITNRSTIPRLLFAESF